MYKHFFKRFFDIVLSLIAAVMLLPLFIVVGIIIFIDDPGPIFFKQKRVLDVEVPHDETEHSRYPDALAGTSRTVHNADGQIMEKVEYRRIAANLVDIV